MSYSLSLFYLKTHIIVKQLKRQQNRQRFYHSIYSRWKKNKWNNCFCCPGIINVSRRHPVKGKQEHLKPGFLFNLKTLILLTCQHSSRDRCIFPYIPGKCEGDEKDICLKNGSSWYIWNQLVIQHPVIISMVYFFWKEVLCIVCSQVLQRKVFLSPLMIIWEHIHLSL